MAQTTQHSRTFGLSGFDIAGDTDTTGCHYGTPTLHDTYCMKEFKQENSNTNNILLGRSIPSSIIVAAAQQYGKATSQHSRRKAGPVSSLWDAGDDWYSKGQSRLIPTGGTQVMFGMQAMIWSRTSQTRTRLIPMDVDWTQGTAADDSEQDQPTQHVVTRSRTSRDAVVFS